MEDYSQKKLEIKGRLAEFKKRGESSNKEIFEELAFCILTANASAKMGLRSIEAIKPVLYNGSPEDISHHIKGKHRFWRIRPKFIFETREYLKEEFSFNLKEILKSSKDREDLRDFFAANKRIKGIGYKEASHFLRNIGFSGYAILDKHILNCLREFGVINGEKKPANKPSYLEIEKKMRRFSEEIGIDMDELDLLLWSRQTGEILK